MKICCPSSFRVLKRKVTYLRFNASVNTGNSYPIFAIYLILAMEIDALVGIKFWSVIWLAAIIMFLAVFFFTASSLPCSSSVDELEKRLAALRNPWAKDWRTLFSAEVYDWGSFLQFVLRSTHCTYLFRLSLHFLSSQSLYPIEFSWIYSRENVQLSAY